MWILIGVGSLILIVVTVILGKLLVEGGISMYRSYKSKKNVLRNEWPTQ